MLTSFSSMPAACSSRGPMIFIPVSTGSSNGVLPPIPEEISTGRFLRSRARSAVVTIITQATSVSRQQSSRW